MPNVSQCSVAETESATPPYLYFANYSTNMGYTGVIPNICTVFPSNDGHNFGLPLRSNIAAPTPLQTTTPSPFYRASDDTFWLLSNISNNVSASGQQLYLQLYSLSKQGLFATHVLDIDFTPVIGTGSEAVVWPGQWFVDPATGNVHVYCSASSNMAVPAYTGFAIYETHPTNAGMTTWSTPVAITGTSLPANMIDPFVIGDGSGGYLCFYKNETTSFIEVLASASLTTGWSVLKSGDWAGWGSHLEGPSIITNNAGQFQILLDPYRGDGTQIQYSTSSSLTSGWSALAACTSADTKVLQHGTVIKTPPNWNAGSLYNDYKVRTASWGLSSPYTALDTMMQGLDAAGILKTMDFFYIYALDTSAHALTNLIGNGLFAAKTVGGMTFSAGHGYTGNGSTGYIDTVDFPWPGTGTAGGSYVPQFALNSASFGYYNLTSRTTAAATAVMGSQKIAGGAATDDWPLDTGPARFAEINNNASSTTAPANTQGLWVLSRVGSTNLSIYKNGNTTPTNTVTSASSHLPDLSFLTNAARGGPSSTPTGFSTDQLAMAFIASGWTATQQNIFAGYVNAYMTALGINVY
jgi:hypothetical protein